jgi:hypothetical protein
MSYYVLRSYELTFDESTTQSWNNLKSFVEDIKVEEILVSWQAAGPSGCIATSSRLFRKQEKIYVNST